MLSHPVPQNTIRMGPRTVQDSPRSVATAYAPRPMALTAKARRDPTVRLVAFLLAGGVPLACYLATASAHGYWLDAGVLVAASTDLGISHPPGHPLAALVGNAMTLIPLGPLALRVALSSAVFAAIAAGFLFLAIETTVQSLGVSAKRIATPIALGATWLVVGSYGWWLQAIRPEVYALQAALVVIALERIVALEAAWPTHDVRPLYVAALCIGLGLANHHFLAFLALPALAPTLARVHRAKGARAILIALACLGVGLLTYVYLPVRAAQDPPLDLGDPTSASRFFWVVSAEAFRKNTGGGVPQPIWERLLDVIVLLTESLHVVPILIALGGAYAILRGPGARRIGYVWICVLAIYVAGRAWLGFVRSNPDALGYLMPAFGAAGALAGAFVGAALEAVGGANKARPRSIAVVIALVVAALGLLQIHESAPRATLARFAATDVFDDPRLRDLPPHAIVIAHAPQTVFELWGAQATEQIRPDVTVVPVPFLAYPGMVDRLVDRRPELSAPIRGYLLDGAFRLPDLQTLAAEHHVMIELDPRVPTGVYETLVARGTYHEALPDEAYEDDRRSGIEAQRATWDELERTLGPDRSDPETRAQLLWHYYMSALYYAAVGENEAARDAVAHATAINPDAAELRALSAHLATTEEAIDVTPFMPQPLE